MKLAYSNVLTIFFLFIILGGAIFLSNSNTITSYTTLNNARCISTNFPYYMNKGETKEVSFTIVNNGRAIWNDKYRLSSKNAPPNLWGVEQIRLDKIVSKGDSIEVKFKIIAPSKPETYSSEWQMAQLVSNRYINYFGEKCKQTIKVIDIGRCVSTKEICDNIDNDCDGFVDEGVKNLCNSCGQVPYEVCDGIDNDCDLDTDEGCSTECIDNDNDGFCNDLDCNDNNENIYPGAEELCTDNIDNNCNTLINDVCKPNEFEALTNNPFVFYGTNIELDDVYSDGSILLAVGETKVKIPRLKTKNVNGLTISVIDSFYTVEKDHRKAIIKITP